MYQQLAKVLKMEKMDKGRKFRPWILGGLSMAAFAIAIGVGWPTLAVAQNQRVTPPIEQHRQIWECTINGQKTFSDHRCGDKASLREIGPINIMDSTPILSHSRSNVSESSGQPRDSDPSQQADLYPSEQQSADNSFAVDDAYPVFLGNSSGEHSRSDHEKRRRSDREHRPQSHDRGGLQPRRN
jgi:hypothetical protein